MPRPISPRIAAFVDKLPLVSGMRILEIGCGPGVAAREVSRRIGDDRIVAIDRSAKAIGLAKDGSKADAATGRLEFWQVAIEDFALEPGEDPFDLAFAMRVGALDGRHPDIGIHALRRLKRALKPEALLFIDERDAIRCRDIDTK